MDILYRMIILIFNALIYRIQIVHLKNQQLPTEKKIHLEISNAPKTKIISQAKKKPN